MTEKFFPNTQIIRPAALAEKLDVCHKTIYNWINTGVLPKPRPIGPQRVGWIPEDLDPFFTTMAGPKV